jgi:hypothetical protein
MTVSTITQGVTHPGEKSATREAIMLEIPPPRAPGDVPDPSTPNGSLNLTILNLEMIGKVKLGERYKVVIVADDDDVG